jgi:hypothetical protein
MPTFNKTSMLMIIKCSWTTRMRVKKSTSIHMNMHMIIDAHHQKHQNDEHHKHRDTSLCIATSSKCMYIACITSPNVCIRHANARLCNLKWGLKTTLSNRYHHKCNAYDDKKRLNNTSRGVLHDAGSSIERHHPDVKCASALFTLNS